MKKRRRFPKIRIYRDKYGRRRWVIQVGLHHYIGFWTIFISKWWKVRGAIQHHLAEKHAALGGCERCGSFWQLRMTPAATAYHWNGKGEDPNRDRRFCPGCEHDYNEYWDAMWQEYEYSRG